jgi:hypothetical protein
MSWLVLSVLGGLARVLAALATAWGAAVLVLQALPMEWIAPVWWLACSVHRAGPVLQVLERPEQQPKQGARGSCCDRLALGQ